MSRTTMVAAAVLCLAACDGVKSGRAPEAPAGGLAVAVDAAAPVPSAAPARAAAERTGESWPARFTAGSALPTMIIRTGQVFIRVDSLEPAVGRVLEAARRAGGFVANSAVQGGEGEQRTATLEVKVPSARYEEAMGGLQGIGRILSSTTSAQDVGEEYVDVSARVANGRRLEGRLLNLLASRTGKLDDVLSVERELARVREEIERYEGRLRYLRSQVSLSTLTVTLAEPAPVVGRPGSHPIGEAFTQAWRNAVLVVAGGIELAGGVLPVFLVGLLGFLGVRRWRRARTG